MSARINKNISQVASSVEICIANICKRHDIDSRGYRAGFGAIDKLLSLPNLSDEEKLFLNGSR